MNRELLDFARACEAMWRRVDKDGPVPSHRPELGPCWLWTGATTHNGYGHLRIFEQMYMAHRLTFMLENGFLSESLLVLHDCDNPPCVRPGHLFAGTQQDNIDDAARKGRLARGEALPQAKLTEAGVKDIKRALAGGARGFELAKLFGVTQATICDIKKGRKWSWVQA